MRPRVQASLNDQLLGGQVEDSQDVPLELCDRDLGDPRDIFEAQRLGIVFLDMRHGCGDAPVDWMLLVGHPQIARDTGQASDLALAIEERDLMRQAPAGRAIWVEMQL